MKRMIYFIPAMITILISFLVIMSFNSCSNQTVGYLFSENAQYVPDTLYVKAVLDEEVSEDAQRIKLELPWQSGWIEGVQGTAPIIYTIESIEPSIEAVNQFSIFGRGMIELPYDHTVPMGTYIIKLRVENEGHSHVIENALTVVVH